MIYLDPGGTCASQTLMAAVTLPTRMVLEFRKRKRRRQIHRMLENSCAATAGRCFTCPVNEFQSAAAHGKIPLFFDRSCGRAH